MVSENLIAEAEKQQENTTEEENKKESSRATKLRDLILRQNIEFAVDEAKEAYARIEIHGHYEVYNVKSQSFKDIVIELAEAEFNSVIAKNALESALDSIGAKARRSKNEKNIAVRVKYLAEKRKIYLDLCNDKWQVIEIDSKGWRILDNSPIWFKRTNDLDKLPTPINSNDNYTAISKLKKYINYTNDDNFDMYVAWLLSNLLTDVSVPILILEGTAGVGKSFTSEILRSIIDPAKQLKTISRVKPKPEDIVLDVSKSRVLVYDNFSAGTITAELSDLFATIATNATAPKRALYTDDEIIVVRLGRSLLFNGIDDLVKREDLLSRSIVINLEELTERKSESKMRAQFERDHPYILGGLLNVASEALKNQGKSQFNEKQIRFTDFGRFVENGAEAMQWQDDHFKAIYTNNVFKAKESLIQSNFFILALVELLEKSYTKEITHTATKLIEEVNKCEAVPLYVPKGAIPYANKVLDRLKRDKALLNQLSIEYSITKKVIFLITRFQLKNSGAGWSINL
ncbi:TPA: hypothetical protein QCV70_002485 [Bacillus cereus]|nr:hypothetical protein [Bacillus cereus]